MVNFPPADESYGVESEGEPFEATPAPETHGQSLKTEPAPPKPTYPDPIQARAVRIVDAAIAFVDLALFEVATDDPATQVAVRRLREIAQLGFEKSDLYGTLIERIADLIEAAPKMAEEVELGLEPGEDPERFEGPDAIEYLEDKN